MIHVGGEDPTGQSLFLSGQFDEQIAKPVAGQAELLPGHDESFDESDDTIFDERGGGDGAEIDEKALRVHITRLLGALSFAKKVTGCARAEVGSSAWFDRLVRFSAGSAGHQL
jgi:hypothetical protein